MAAAVVVVGTGKDAAPVVDVGAGVGVGVVAATVADGGVVGNKRLQVSVPTTPSGFNPAAC